MSSSHAILFDTLAYANKLKNAGVPDKQAEAQSEALAHIFDYKAATKKDLQEMDIHLSAKITALDIKIDNKVTELNSKIDTKFSEVSSKIESKISELKVEIANMKSDVLKWVIGLLLAQSALLISALKFLH